MTTDSGPGADSSGSDARSRAKARTAGFSPARVLLVTGMSGAGRSTALKTLEDIGYEAIDNLPLSLVPALIENAAADAPAIAVGAYARTRGFRLETMIETLDLSARRAGRELKILFVDCDDERLERRYTETRRPHPLAGDRPVMDGIRLERRMLYTLRGRADLVIDTSQLTPGELKRLVSGHFGLDARRLRIFVTSFSYRYGIPREADLIFDVRFLDNPHYIPQLRGLTGLDPAVAAHIEKDPDLQPFLDGLWHWLGPLLPRYEKEGKTYLTIAVGCTGGRHRSVYVAERLAALIRGDGWPAELEHRHLSLSASAAPARVEAPVAAV